MVKRLGLTIILILTISLILVGCSGGSYKLIKGSIKYKDNSICGNYSKYTGNFYKKVKFNEGEVVNFSLTLNTVKGELTAKLIDSDENIMFELNDEKTVKIKKTDNYKVQIIAEEHKGDFKLTWARNN